MEFEGSRESLKEILGRENVYDVMNIPVDLITIKSRLASIEGALQQLASMISEDIKDTQDIVMDNRVMIAALIGLLTDTKVLTEKDIIEKHAETRENLVKSMNDEAKLLCEAAEGMFNLTKKKPAKKASQKSTGIGAKKITPKMKK